MKYSVEATPDSKDFWERARSMSWFVLWGSIMVLAFGCTGQAGDNDGQASESVGREASSHQATDEGPSGHDRSQPISTTNCWTEDRIYGDDEGPYPSRGTVVLQSEDPFDIDREIEIVGLPLVDPFDLETPDSLVLDGHVLDAVQDLASSDAGDDGYLVLSFEREATVTRDALHVVGGEVYSLLPEFPCQGVRILQGKRRLMPADTPHSDGIAGLFDAIAAGDLTALCIMDNSCNLQAHNRKLVDQWWETPITERIVTLAQDGTTTPPGIRARLTSYMLLLGVPDTWQSLDMKLCSQTSMGRGPECTRTATAVDNFLTLHVVQFDEEPIELSLESGDQVIKLGELTRVQVSPTDEGAMIAVVDPTAHSATTFEEIAVIAKESENKLVTAD